MTTRSDTFVNEPPIDFTIEAERHDFQSALDALRDQIAAGSLRAAPIVGGKEFQGSEQVSVIDPSAPSKTIGTAYYAQPNDAERAIEVLLDGAKLWRNTPASERAAVLFRAADKMSAEKRELSALIIRETGKPWREADADVAEAIDFCRYYAHEMINLATPRKMQELFGESNLYLYQPRGIALVIAPWNFPLAIPCGMTVAALVAGNAVILKPAEQSSLIAFRFANILLEAGVPPEAFAFLPGRGEIIGRMLVEHPAIDVICFTGSKEVGLLILESAAKVRAGQASIKRVITELGGKNAIIIDEDADLDEAIKGALYSAFGYAGQKCSACSRIIVVGDAYEPFLERFAEATGDLIIGKASDPATFVGPVIDHESQQRLLSAIRAAEKSSTLLFQGSVPEEGYFVPPTIFRDVKADDSLWKNELFGPVVACCRANDFEHALALANDSAYALTGGLFSRSPAHIQQAVNEFQVGNLYINRGCTGAIVGRQPFGGFKMSGVGSKAGGPDYLLQFMEPRTVTENTMRRGFTPELS